MSELERKKQSQSMYLQLMASRVCSDISTGFEVSREKLNKSLGEVSSLHQATDCPISP